jgi:hypothetical protein
MSVFRRCRRVGVDRVAALPAVRPRRRARGRRTPSPNASVAKVSWAFVDKYVDQTLANRGWWKTLDRAAAGSRRVLAGGADARTWLAPRLHADVVTSDPNAEVVEIAVSDPGLTLILSNGDALTVDHVVFASGQRADLARALCHRLRVNPRLRAVLRLHQGLPLLGDARRGRDAARRLTAIGPHPGAPLDSARCLGEGNLHSRRP